MHRTAIEVLDLSFSTGTLYDQKLTMYISLVLPPEIRVTDHHAKQVSRSVRSKFP